jgi:putative oxidoreductase
MHNNRGMLDKVLSPHSERAYAIMRVVVGLLFSFHGMQKVLGFMVAQPQPVMSQLWIGGVIELLTGLMIVAGLFTRWAAFLASGTMAVAYCQFHWKLQLGAGLIPTVNKGELAVVYCFLFLFIACKGAGSWSVDGRR